MTASCSDCALCCKLLTVEEINKPSCQWCPAIERTAHGRRCGIYAERPDACRTFECIWLQSQVRTPAAGFPAGQVLPPELRPDRCHVVFCQDAYLNGPVDKLERRMILFVDPDWPDAWKSPKVMEQINGFLARDRTTDGNVTNLVRTAVEIIIGLEKITLQRGTGRMLIERTEPYLGMLRRVVSFPSGEDFTLDPQELMERRR